MSLMKKLTSNTKTIVKSESLKNKKKINKNRKNPVPLFRALWQNYSIYQPGLKVIAFLTNFHWSNDTFSLILKK